VVPTLFFGGAIEAIYQPLKRYKLIRVGATHDAKKSAIGDEPHDFAKNDHALTKVYRPIGYAPLPGGKLGCV
jgi:hypothetical protein